MATITEDHVSLETAKLLKEKGFDEPIQYFYKFDSKELYRGTVFTNTQIGDKFYNAPTLQMAMKWLREVHGLFIQIGNDDLDYWWQVQDVVNKDEFGDPVSKTPSYGGSETYELAVESALNYCVKNLI